VVCGDSPCVSVLVSMHTCSVSCLCVCVFLILCTWLWEDQLGSFGHILSNFILFLTCQVAMPLGITCVCCVYVQVQNDDQMDKMIFKLKIRWYSHCSI
jgi:hypothetical protein